nr:hypothetical protein [Tanacetum cinerariifolium]
MPVTRQRENDAMTPELIQAMIDQAIQRNSTHTQDDASQNSGGGPRRPVQPARVCSYTDFLKCQPLNFKGTEGIVGLSYWLEMIELVFYISGCVVDNQVKFATCTLLGAALTWWNGHVRTLGHDATYATTWGTLKKKLTDKYCPKCKIKKLEIKLWNFKVRRNDVAAYTQRFQELALMCTKFLTDETEKVDKYISRLPNNIHGNVMSIRPTTLDEALELANDLMDQKLRIYAERQVENKRKLDNNNYDQQKLLKKQNVCTQKFDCISFGERTIALLLAHERFSEIKQDFREEQHQPENIQELLCKLLNDLQVLNRILPERGEHAAQISTPYWKCPVFYDDDDEYSIQYREYLENSSNAITPDLPIEDPEVSLIIRNEELNTIPKKESEEFIKSIVEDLVLIPCESEENIESKDSYDSNLDEPDLLVTLLSDVNEDECFSLGGDTDEINDFEVGYYDSEGDIIYLKSLLSDDTTPNLPPEVTDKSQKDKNHAKWTKLSTGSERARKIEAKANLSLMGQTRTHFNGPGVSPL